MSKSVPKILKKSNISAANQHRSKNFSSKNVLFIVLYFMPFYCIKKTIKNQVGVKDKESTL